MSGLGAVECRVHRVSGLCPLAEHSFEFCKLTTIRGPWLLLAAGPLPVAAGISGLVESEQRIGRIDGAADIDAAATLIVGAMHGQILPRMLFSPPGSPASMPTGLAGRLAETVLRGIAPQSRQP